MKWLRRLLNFIVAVWNFTDTQERVRILANKIEKQQEKMQEENELLRREIHGREIFICVNKMFDHESDLEYLRFLGGLYHDDRFVYFINLVREKMVQLMLKAVPAAGEVCKGQILGVEFIINELRDCVTKYAILGAKNGKQKT